MEPTESVIAVDDHIHRWQVDGSLDRRLRALSAQPIGGCNACRFADPFSDCQHYLPVPFSFSYYDLNEQLVVGVLRRSPEVEFQPHGGRPDYCWVADGATELADRSHC
jgi:hypothetical protein